MLFSCITVNVCVVPEYQKSDKCSVVYRCLHACCLLHAGLLLAGGRPVTEGSFLLSYLCREVAAELELLQRDCHGVGAKEEDEGHEGQVGNILTGIPHQHPTILHTLLLTQLTPVQVCQVKLQRQNKGRGKWQKRGWERTDNGKPMDGFRSGEEVDTKERKDKR